MPFSRYALMIFARRAVMHSDEDRCLEKTAKPRAANGAEQGDYSDFARRSTAVIRPSVDTVE
jgi:hypothetical protein